MLYCRTLLFIHSKCNSCIYRPQTPSQSLDRLPSFLATTSMFSMSVCAFLFCVGSLCPILPSPDVVQWPRYVWLFATPWTAAHQASVPHPLPAFAQVHVHWISDATYKWYDSTYKWHHMIVIFLSDLLHLLWSLVAPMLLQMVFHFLWLSIIPLPICTPSSLSIRLSGAI